MKWVPGAEQLARVGGVSFIHPPIQYTHSPTVVRLTWKSESWLALGSLFRMLSTISLAADTHGLLAVVTRAVLLSNRWFYNWPSLLPAVGEKHRDGESSLGDNKVWLQFAPRRADSVVCGRMNYNAGHWLLCWTDVVVGGCTMHDESNWSTTTSTTISFFCYLQMRKKTFSVISCGWRGWWRVGKQVNG